MKRLLLFSAGHAGAGTTSYDLPLPVEYLGATDRAFALPIDHLLPQIVDVELALPIEHSEAADVAWPLPIEHLTPTWTDHPLRFMHLAYTLRDLRIPFEHRAIVRFTLHALPTGADGEPYSALITVDQGTPPYTWAIIGGALPLGLSLNTATGAITGTPTEIGVFPITVRVTDATGIIATRTYGLVIGGLPIESQPQLDDGLARVVNEVELSVVEREVSDTAVPVWRSISGIELAAGEAKTVIARPAERDVLMLDAVAPTAADYFSAGPWSHVGTVPIPIRDVAHDGSGRWVAVGGAGTGSQIYTSDNNGASWTARSNPLGTTNINVIAYGNGLFVATTLDGRIITSPNGTTWTERSNPVTSQTPLWGVAYGGGRWTVVGARSLSSPGNPAILTSTNGTSWAFASYEENVGPNFLRGVTYTGTQPYLWIAAGNGPTVHLSSNGTLWHTAAINGIPTVNGAWDVGYRPEGDYLTLVGVNGMIFAGKPHPMTWERQRIPDIQTGEDIFLTHSISALGATWVTGGVDLLVNRGESNATWVVEPGPGPGIITALAADANRLMVFVQLANGTTQVHTKTLIPLAGASIGRTSGATIPITITAGATPTTVTQLQLRAKRVTIEESTSVENTVDATASIIANGPQAFRGAISPDLSLAAAQELANRIVTTYRDGLPTLTWTTNSVEDFSRAAIMEREVGDRVRVQVPRRDIDAEYIIVERHDSITRGQIHRSTYTAIPAPD